MTAASEGCVGNTNTRYPVIYMNDDFEFDSPALDVEDLFSAFVENAAWMGEIELSYTAFRKIPLMNFIVSMPTDRRSFRSLRQTYLSLWIYLIA